MAANPPLKKPPLQEAVFEIRFPSVEDYAILAGGMAVAHETDFPVVEKLQYAELPEFIQVVGLVKHRFLNQERGKLFQTGPDVISVNLIKYETFNFFINDIKKIMASAERFGINFKNPTRISLRYINRFVNVSNPLKTLNIQPPFTSSDFSKTNFIQIREVEQINEQIFISTNFQFPVDDKDLILDLDAFIEPPVGDWDTERILAWATQVHDDIIWNKFISLVSKAEMEARK